MELLEKIQAKYGKEFHTAVLLRDWIGQVYEVAADKKRYIAKLFRKEYREQAFQSIEVMRYLKQQGFPVPEILAALDGSFYFEYEGCIGVIYEYIDGEEVDADKHLKDIGMLAGQMRKLMESYPKEAVEHGYDFFIKRYLTIMEQKHYEERKRFEELGQMIWKKVKDLPRGFLHGDLHGGNMFLREESLVLYDFDACGIACPVYDIAAVCDATNYFDSSIESLRRGLVETKQHVLEFLEGYSSYYSLSEEEQQAVYYCIAMRHYDIQATIIMSQGIDCVDAGFLDGQKIWLENWLEIVNEEVRNDR